MVTELPFGLQLASPDDAQILRELGDFLTGRERRRATLLTDLARKRECKCSGRDYVVY